MTKQRYIAWMWRLMWWSWVVMLIVLPVIAVINIVYALSSGRPIPWIDVLGAVGIALWTTAIMWLSRRWFNFVAGSETCKWRHKS